MTDTTENAVEEVVEESLEWEPSTDTEKKAANLGYHPDKGEKSADQFLMYHEARTDIRSENKSARKKLETENSKLQDQINALSQNQNIQINENIAFYESRISVLENNLTGAKENGHTDMAVEIIEQINKERVQLSRLKGTKNTPSAPTLDTAVLDDWYDNNNWINEESEKAQFAKDLFQELNEETMSKIPPKTAQSVIDSKWRRILRRVERETAEEFGEEIPAKGSRKKAPARVTGAKTTEKASTVRNIKSLAIDERAIYNAQVKSSNNPRGIWTDKEFWDKLDKAKGV